MAIQYPDETQVALILKEMKEQGKTFWDEDADYFDGEQRIYKYDKEKGTFCCEICDVIAASYADTHYYSVTGITSILKEFSCYEFREAGFMI